MATVTMFIGGQSVKLRGSCQGYFTKAGPDGWGEWRYKRACCRFVGEWRAGERYWGHWSYRNGVKYSGYFEDDGQYGQGEWWNSNGQKCVLHADGFLYLA